MSNPPVQFTLTSRPLPRAEAMALMDALEEMIAPEASAVSMNEVDEAAGLWQVTAYYTEHPSETSFEPVLTARALAADAISIDALPNTDWVARSLEGLKPVIAGRFCIHGEHDPLPRAGGISLQIDAGTAFGTGHHGTTRGCLLALDQILKQRRPRNVLDLGCGTGVLGLAAACATRRRVTASDIDPEAERVTRANAALNGAGPLLQVFTAAGTGDKRIAAGTPYDLIFANILARPLIALADPLTRLMMPRGDIVLSGLTADQERRVLAAYRSRGAILHKRIRLEGWSTLWLKKMGQK